MKNNSTDAKSRKEEFERLVDEWNNYYKAPLMALILHLQEKYNYSLQDIADIPGFPMSKQSLWSGFFRKTKKEKVKEFADYGLVFVQKEKGANNGH